MTRDSPEASKTAAWPPISTRGEHARAMASRAPSGHGEAGSSARQQNI